MKPWCLELLLALLLYGAKATPTYLELNRDEFMWGVATAAYQIEGATAVEGRRPSIWDSFVQLPHKIAHGENADVADLSYYKYRNDIQLMKSLGVKHYRFSISWSRIFPEGKGEINHAGILHYNNFIDSLVKNGINPVVTLYHWDLPQSLEDQYQGWLGPQVVDDFTAYADTCFKHFGDRVKMWITLNEPWTFVLNGYVSGVFAPGRCSNRTRCSEGDSAVEGYAVAHNALLAHASVVQLYKSKYASAGGVIGITLNIDWAYPLDPSSAADRAAAQRRNEFTFSWFADPIYFGSYPESMRKGVGNRLPEFTADEAAMVKGSVDFIGLNHYSSWYLRDGVSGDEGWFGDQRAVASKYDLAGALIGPQGGSVWLNQVPEGIYETLMWVSDRYGRPTIVITENGCDMLSEDEPRDFDVKRFGGDSGGKYLQGSGYDDEASLEGLLALESDDTKALLTDDFRVAYFDTYLPQVHRAMKAGADVRGYFAWSLLDNFEWADGFNMRFGLFRVNFSDPERHRSPKLSAFFYRDYIRSFPTKLSGDDFDGKNGNHDLRRNWRGGHSDHGRGEEAEAVAVEASTLLSFLARAREHAVLNSTGFMRYGLGVTVP